MSGSAVHPPPAPAKHLSWTIKAPIGLLGLPIAHDAQGFPSSVSPGRVLRDPNSGKVLLFAKSEDAAYVAERISGYFSCPLTKISFRRPDGGLMKEIGLAWINTQPHRCAFVGASLLCYVRERERNERRHKFRLSAR